jgi:hypothetical protein
MRTRTTGWTIGWAMRGVVRPVTFEGTGWGGAGGNINRCFGARGYVNEFGGPLITPLVWLLTPIGC